MQDGAFFIFVNNTSKYQVFAVSKDDIPGSGSDEITLKIRNFFYFLTTTIQQLFQEIFYHFTWFIGRRSRTVYLGNTNVKN